MSFERKWRDGRIITLIKPGKAAELETIKAKAALGLRDVVVLLLLLIELLTDGVDE